MPSNWPPVLACPHSLGSPSDVTRMNVAIVVIVLGVLLAAGPVSDTAA
jgi:hypothetical protein